MPTERGVRTSEYKNSITLSITGEVVLFVGVVVALAGLHGPNLWWSLTGLGLALIGAGMSCVSVISYSAARSRVKAATEAPPARLMGGKV